MENLLPILIDALRYCLHSENNIYPSKLTGDSHQRYNVNRKQGMFASYHL